MTVSLLNCIFNNLQKNWSWNWDFILGIRPAFLLKPEGWLVSATFMPILDYGDILYMNASAQCLRSIDTLYRGTLRFILNCKTLTHHCTLYTRVGWPSLVTRRLIGSVTGILSFTKPFWVYYLFICAFLLFRNVVGRLFVRWTLSC